MTKYIVNGGKPLFGEVEISGAKNAAVAIIPAAILVDGVCRIENIPQISDVTAILKILEQLGASIRSINRHTVEIDSRHIHTTRTSYELLSLIHISAPGCYGEILHLFLAKGLKFSEQHLDPDEFLNVERVPFDEMVHRCMNGEIDDAKTVAAVLRAKVLLNL